jgi:hypothetical protein
LDIFKREYPVTPVASTHPEVHHLQAVVSQLVLSGSTQSTRVH